MFTMHIHTKNCMNCGVKVKGVVSVHKDQMLLKVNRSHASAHCRLHTEV